jgi:hypothetical protein
VEVTYYLDEEGITFFADGIIVFDCSLERIRREPERALDAMRLLRDVYEND